MAPQLGGQNQQFTVMALRGKNICRKFSCYSIARLSRLYNARYHLRKDECTDSLRQWTNPSLRRYGVTEKNTHHLKPTLTTILSGTLFRAVPGALPLLGRNMAVMNQPNTVIKIHLWFITIVYFRAIHLKAKTKNNASFLLKITWNVHCKFSV